MLQKLFPSASRMFVPAATAALLLIVAGPLARTTAGQEPVGIDRILAVVNDEVITLVEFQREYRRMTAELRNRTADLPPEQVLRRQVLDRMIADRLQLQFAARQGITVPDSTVDRAVEDLARRNNLTVEQLRGQLTTEGMTEAELRAVLHRQLVIRRLVDREIASRVNVTNEEVDRFLAEQAVQGGLDAEYLLSHILVSLPEGASSEAIGQAERRARAARARAAQGVEFARLAAEFSDSPDALEGGRLGWRRAGQIPTVFMQALDGMQPGDVSDVIRSPNGFHVLRLDDRRGGAQQTVVQTRARHILLKVDDFLSAEEGSRRLEQLRDRLAAGEDFAALARAHSQDTITAVKGGDIGWVNPGETDPAFERAMAGLQPGQVSPPVRTGFGVHLIEVLERRRQTAGEQLIRSAARQQLHARKTEERYEQWVRQLRDEAYVVVKVAGG